jgi:hypothetical protein
MNKKYRIRHAILSVLHEKGTKNFEHPDIEQLEMTAEEVANSTGYSVDEIKAQLDVLHLAEEIDINWRERVMKLLCVVKGSAALHDEKYLTQGRQEFWNDTYDVVKTVSAIILVSIALGTFILNVVSTRENTRLIEDLNARVDSIQGTLVSNIANTRLIQEPHAQVDSNQVILIPKVRDSIGMPAITE